MRLKTIQDLGPLSGKRVLVRCNFDVPMHEGVVSHDAVWRIEAALPLLTELSGQGARVIVLSHRGRPQGEEKELSLEPLRDYISARLERPLFFGGEEPKDGEIVIRENVRFDSRETQNDEAFARELALQGDVFINNDFATAHRAHASVVGITKHLPSAAGPVLEQEVAELSAVRNYSGEGLVMIMGGAKAETKIALIDYFLEKGATVLLGGVLANTVLRERGYPTGISVVDDESDLSGLDIESPLLVVPTDVVVSQSLEEARGQAVRESAGVQQREAMVDVGLQTQQLYAQHIERAELVVWNGPLGLVEIEAFREGSRMIADSFVHSPAKTVTGGGDVVTFLAQEKMLSGIDHVSTGGGSMLAFLAGEPLPGIQALEQT